MAATLTGARRIAAVVCAGAVVAGAFSASAAGAADPTQPPEQLLRKATPDGSGTARGEAALSPAAIVLQAVLHPEGRPPRVMVDGWLYRVGDIVQGSRLIAIGRQSAVFDHQGRRQTVALIPQAGITRLRLSDTESVPALPSAAMPAINAPMRPSARRTNKENP